MKEVYLRESFGGEVCAGGLENILQVHSKTLIDGNRLFYVMANSEQEKALIQLGFVMNPVERDHLMKKVNKEVTPVVEEDSSEPSEYFCLDCGKNHIKGTPSYFAHLGRYQSGQWASAVQKAEDEGEEGEEFYPAEVTEAPEPEEYDFPDYHSSTVAQFTEALEALEDITVLKELFGEVKYSDTKGKVGKLKAVKARIEALKSK